jgi:prepilin-type N-terminal cleavage/methylation domain-containing protein
MNSQKGVSLVELLIGLAIGAITLLLIFTVITDFNIQKSSIITSFETEIDTRLAERMIFLDMRALGPSFGNLKNTFFDFYPDLSKYEFSSSSYERTVVLKNLNDSFIFLVQDSRANSIQIYDPKNAYNKAKLFPSIPAFPDVAIPSVLEFDIDAFCSSLTAVDKTKVLFFDTLSRIRKKQPGITLPPRSPVFAGYVDSKCKSITNVGSLLGVFDTHPDRESFAGIFNSLHILDDKIANLDVFFRTVPAYGGGTPIVRVQNVKFIKYQLEEQTKDKDNNYYFKLNKYIYNPDENLTNHWESKFMMSNYVKELKFVRRDITNGLVEFQLTLVPEKTN